MAPALACMLLLFADAPASPAEAGRRAVELVRELESPSFRKREAAAKELLALGVDAKAALEAGALSPDAEVRERCRRMLPQVQLLDLQARVEMFRRDKEGKQNPPGWERFRKAVGDDAKARDFFAGMILRRPQSAASLGDPARMARDLTARCREINQERDNTPEIVQNINGKPEQAKPNLSFDHVEIAFWLFVSADPAVRAELRKATESDDMPLGYILRDEFFETALRDKEKAPVLEKLIIGWMRELKAANNVDQNDLEIAFELVKDFNLKSGLQVAVDWLRDQRKGEYASLPSAMTVIGKLGDKTHVPLFAKLLDDSNQYTSINFNRKRMTVQYRDIALAMTLRLQGLKLLDFGYDANARNEQGLYPYYLGFADDASRNKAFAAYADWLRR